MKSLAVYVLITTPCTGSHLWSISNLSLNLCSIPAKLHRQHLFHYRYLFHEKKKSKFKKKKKKIRTKTYPWQMSHTGPGMGQLMRYGMIIVPQPIKMWCSAAMSWEYLKPMKTDNFSTSTISTIIYHVHHKSTCSSGKQVFSLITLTII